MLTSENTAIGVILSTTLLSLRKSSRALFMGTRSTSRSLIPCRTSPANALNSTTAGKLSSAIAVKMLKGRNFSIRFICGGSASRLGLKKFEDVRGGSHVGTMMTAMLATITSRRKTSPPVRRSVRRDAPLRPPKEHASSSMIKGIVTNCDARIKIVPNTDQYSVYCGTSHEATVPSIRPSRHLTPNGTVFNRCNTRLIMYTQTFTSNRQIQMKSPVSSAYEVY